MRKKIIPIIFLLVVSLLFVRNLAPWNGLMFTGHDETQATRVREYSLNVRKGYIPPRISPNMSFGMGYPLFTFYAPFSYWVTSGFDLIGQSEVDALKVSFSLAVIVASIGMYGFLKKFFSQIASIVGAVAYISSPFLAVDLFVRANLAEVWFFALFPLALWALVRKKVQIFDWILASVFLSFLFSVHTVFSLFAIPIPFLVALVISKSFYNFTQYLLTILGGILLSGYFMFPALFELPFVQATDIATQTNYSDHFLCLNQLWSSAWGFAGSASGCTADGMSFMVGKVQIVFAIIGVGMFLISIIQKRVSYFEKIHTLLRLNSLPKKSKTIVWGILVATVFSTFLTLSVSQPIWIIFEPFLSIFQFPWRFLVFVVFGMAFFVALGISMLNKKSFQYFISGIVLVGLLWVNLKFFVGQMIKESQFEEQYVSQEYVSQKSAFNVAEYVPTSVSYDDWRKLENVESEAKIPIGVYEFEKTIPVDSQVTEAEFVAPIHYAPYWHITVDENQIIPKKFDSLGRPLIKLSSNTSKITISFQQTYLEQVSSYISLATIGTMIFLIGISKKTIKNEKES